MGQARKYGPKQGDGPRGRGRGRGQVMVSEGRCVLGLDLGCTGIRGPQNVLMVVGFEARCWLSAHLE